MSRLALSALLLGAALAGCRNSGRGAAIEECVPGESLVIGCNPECGIGGMCAGDPVLRVCDGALGISGCGSTSDPTTFVESDDACGSLCPRRRVICPPSGSVAVTTRGIGSDRYVCDWAVEHRGILPPGGRAPETIACTAGAPIEIGCSLACGVGECEGSAAIRTCDGTISVADCQSGTGPALRETSSSSGCDTRCPQYVLTCPPSGALTVVPRSTSSGSEWLCEWVAQPVPHRAGGTEVCSPGQRYVVACGAGCSLGTCAGDGHIRVCDGNVTPDACASATDPATWLDDSSRSSCDPECPGVTVTCPPSGAFTVVSYPSYDDEGFGCEWSMRAAGLGE